MVTRMIIITLQCLQQDTIEVQEALQYNYTVELGDITILYLS